MKTRKQKPLPAPARLCETPATNEIRARFRGDDKKLGVAMIAHANDLERRLAVIASDAAIIRDEWLRTQPDGIRLVIANIRKLSDLTASGTTASL